MTDHHQVIAAFVERRSQSPEGAESTILPVSSRTVYNLHSGRWRALTWYEKPQDTVWLLGAGWHESGSRTDAYAYLNALDSKGELFPAYVDIADHEESRRPVWDAVVAAVADEAGPAVAAARNQPGVPVEFVLGDALRLRVLVERVDDDQDSIEELWVGVGMPPMVEGVLPPGPSWQMLLLAKFADLAGDRAELEWKAEFPVPPDDPKVINEVVACFVA